MPSEHVNRSSKISRISQNISSDIIDYWHQYIAYKGSNGVQYMVYKDSNGVQYIAYKDSSGVQYITYKDSNGVLISKKIAPNSYTTDVMIKRLVWETFKNN